MGHDHDDPPYKVPHYSKFKVKGVKQLEQLQAALAKHGLKDPWIRNEVWRFHPGFGSRGARALKLFTRGMPLGAALGLAAAVVAYTMEDSHGGHGGH